MMTSKATKLPPNNNFVNHRQKVIRRKRMLLIASIVILILAWVYGYYNSNANVTPYLKNVIPGAAHFGHHGKIFIGYSGSDDTVLGYAMKASAMGYGGPVDILVGVDPEGKVIGVQILKFKETPGFFRALPKNDYFSQFLGKSYQDRIQIGEDIDGVSGATLSSEAVAAGIRSAVREISEKQLDVELPPKKEPIRFGIPEITLITLYAIGFFGHKTRNAKYKKWLRWGTLLTGMVVLGFVFNKPLTLANIISFLAGYWPDWHYNLYWYLLLFGIFFVITTEGKNPYCNWFCPFGAVQECLGAISGAKSYRPKSLSLGLNWVTRAIVFFAIVLGLAFRNPSAASYEIFGTLFDFNGIWAQWVLLAIVLLVSLLMYRPWCNYLCPLRPVEDGIGEIRRWLKELWRKRIRN